jgi:diguanylate cyclase (GGDEF)-like protein
MQKSDQGKAGRIFLSYRRQDDPGFTNAIFQRLELAFGRAQLFMDTGGYLQLGENFILALEAQVASCDVLLAIIGPRWLQTLKERDASTADFVAIEIQAALGQQKRVVPVLVNGADIPRAEELPDGLRPLTFCQASRLSHERFAADCDGLIKDLHSLLAAAAAASIAAEQDSLREAQVGEVDGSADFDRLTGLPNAEKFLADAAAAMAAGGNNQPAMLCIDVDFFSGTPDHLANQVSHQAGDLREVLRSIARRVRRPLRQAILLGRAGRNQFAVFTTSANDRELAVVSESIKRAVQAPVVLRNTEIFLKAAIGIATLRARPPGLEASGEAKNLLDQAEMAASTARSAGGDRVEVFRPGPISGTILRRDPRPIGQR